MIEGIQNSKINKSIRFDANRFINCLKDEIFIFRSLKSVSTGSN